MKKTLAERIQDAETNGCRWLADANVEENPVKAERYYAKAQFWLDRYNLLTGRSDREAPKQ